MQAGLVRNYFFYFFNLISKHFQATVSVGYSAAFSVDCVLPSPVRQQTPPNVAEVEVVEEVEEVEVEVEGVRPGTRRLAVSA